MSVDQLIRDLEAQRDAASERVREACNALREVEASLDDAYKTRADQAFLAQGKKPFLVATEEDWVSHGDAYRVSSGSSIKEVVRWWTEEEFQEKSSTRWWNRLVYIIRLQDDAKSPDILEYWNEGISIPVDTTRRLLRLRRRIHV